MKIKRMSKAKWGSILFFTALIIVQLVVFLLLNVGGMVQSFILAFSKYDFVENRYEFAGFYNFADVIRSLTQDPLLRGSIWNSVVYYLCTLLIITPSGWLFSFLIYKKLPLHGLLKVILFMPSVISGLIYIMIYKSFVQDALPVLLAPFGIELVNVFNSPATGYTALVVFSVWMQLCGSVLIGTGLMSKIPQETIEALHVDGATIVQEFIHVTLPTIYPLVALGLSTGIMVILQGQPNTFPFFNTQAPDHVYTIGYYLFVKVMNAGSGSAVETVYPYSAAAGILISYLCLPVVLLLKMGLDKIGPSED